MRFPETHPFWDAFFTALRAHDSRAAYALVCKRWLCEMRVYPLFPFTYPSPPLTPTPLESIEFPDAACHLSARDLAAYAMAVLKMPSVSYLDTWTRPLDQQFSLTRTGDYVRSTENIILKSLDYPFLGCYTWPKGTPLSVYAFYYCNVAMARFSQGFAQDTIELETVLLNHCEACETWMQKLACIGAGNPWPSIMWQLNSERQ